MQERRFLAGIHGINLDKEMNKNKEESSFMFGDPKDYEKMSDGEKKEKTRQMMGKHKSWAANTMRK